MRLLYEEGQPSGRRCTGLEVVSGQIHQARRTIACLGAGAAKLIPDIGTYVAAKSWSVAHIQLTARESDYLRGIPVLNVVSVLLNLCRINKYFF